MDKANMEWKEGENISGSLLGGVSIEFGHIILHF